MLLSATVACDAAREADFRGEPEFVVSGVVQLVGGSAAELQALHPRAAIYWASALGPGGPRSDDVLQDITLAGGLPAEVRVALYARPPEAAFVVLPPAAEPIALGQIVIFDDADDDHVWSEGEALLGISGTAVVVARGEVSGPRGVLPAGYSLRLVAGCQGADGIFGPEVDAIHIGIFVPPADAAGLGLADARLNVTCVAAPEPWCAGLAARRERCRADPELSTCDECRLGLFPEDVAPEVCDLWRVACAFNPMYDPDECNAEWRRCACDGAPAAPACRPYGLGPDFGSER